MELYERTLDQPRAKGEKAPDLVEFGLTESLLAGLHELLQQVVFWTSANAPKKAGKPKITKLPRPKTAKQLYDAEQDRKAFAHLESVIRFVPQEQWERTIALAQQAGGE
jgi:hypothetical protein